MSVTSKRVCAGFYKYQLDNKIVEVIRVDPNPAFGDKKDMWVAVSLWDNSHSDPLETKGEAKDIAFNMLARSPC